MDLENYYSFVVVAAAAVAIKSIAVVL